jgi:hypothetical protein
MQKQNLEALINMHCTYNSILEAVKLYQWFPRNCQYCGFGSKHIDDYERHVVRNHPGKMAYPCPTPENVASALYIVESIEKELKDTKVKNGNINSSGKTAAKSKSKK